MERVVMGSTKASSFGVVQSAASNIFKHSSFSKQTHNTAIT